MCGNYWAYEAVIVKNDNFTGGKENSGTFLFMQ
jgi:hypothetical protein